MKSSTEAIVLKRLPKKVRNIMTNANANANANATTVTTATADTKASKARAIFNGLLEANKQGTAMPARKDIIALLVANAGCTKAGAATYLQNMKKKAGLVVHKVPATA